MTWNGSGTFNPPADATFPAVAGDLIRSAYFNSVIQALCAGFSNTLPRNGEAAATGNINLGGAYKITNMVVGTVSTDSVTYGQFIANAPAAGSTGQVLTVTSPGVVSYQNLPTSTDPFLLMAAGVI